MSDDNIPQVEDMLTAQRRIMLAGMIGFVIALASALWVLMAFSGVLAVVTALVTFVVVLVGIMFIGSIITVYGTV